ncbi:MULTISPECIES: hypothetical protein [Burkholderia]|uniref:Uncharacterized protein n=1 Tax=Burkholderia pyrrocinia TaxID=60550 RepID=A0A318HT93_BURPY|nr:MULTISPECIES: hypothetical protein [Burkholderia]PXX21694.1 hypothetical protein NA66_104612 [Burkholderia pyrrocinia]SFW90277.1 hypothetical protein SAMN03159384_06976 [Burkholderia sp. NFACC33-1]SFY46435.1 hypothetical protein SAMN03159408_06972 [Burkholderia sp. NFPP32]
MILTQFVRLSTLVAATVIAPVGYAVPAFDTESDLDILNGLPVVTPDNQGVPAIMATLSPPRIALVVPNEPHLLVLQASPTTAAAPAHYRRLVEQSLRSQGTVVLKGSADALYDLKPEWIRVWPQANTIVLTSRMGTRVEGVREPHGNDPIPVVQLMASQIRQALAAERLLRQAAPVGAAARTKRAVLSHATTQDFRKNVDFSIRPTSPTETCTTFGNNLAANTFGRPLTADEQRALSLELGKWCQSGTLSHYQGGSGARAVPHWTYNEKPKLNLLTEWALIRSEDVLRPAQSKHYFWVKSVGEGAGTGFTRSLQDTATFSGNVMHGLMDVAIHGGWGNSYPSDPRSWSYPIGQAHWPDRDPELFGCDDGEFASVCPTGAQVVRLFPSDTFNNQVTVSQATQLAIGGTVGVTGTGSASPALAINASLTVTRTDVTTQSATVNLTSTQTSSARPYSRSTRWRPDVPAVWDYLIARRITGPFGAATPTAATLNPEYDVLWQIPLQPNRDKIMKFSLIYEAGWNNCVREACAGMNPPPDRTIQPQGRVFWQDTVAVDLRS